MKTALTTLCFALSLLAAAPPQPGEKAPDFSLPNLDGSSVQLSAKLAQGPVVLIVLRGFPGYQCPLCNRQVKDFVSKAADFAGQQVILVYPGPRDKGAEFIADKALPAHFQLLLDENYTFTNRYGLRWDAPKETAYPSTFLLDRSGKITFAKISKTHGDRTTAAEILAILKK